MTLDSESLFRRLAEHALVGIYIIQDEHYVYANPKFAEIFGYTLDEVLALDDWLELVALSDRTLVAERVRQRLGGQTQVARYAFHGLCKDGTIIDVEVYGSVTNLNGRPAALGNLVDITDRDLAKEAARESDELFRRAFDDTNVAMVLTDLNHRFVRANGAFARMFGYSLEEILQRSMPDISHPDSLEESFERRKSLLAGESRYFEMEKRYLHKDGHVLWGSTNVSLVRDANGKPSLYVGQVQDISERKTAEESLRQSETRYRSVVEGSVHGVLIKQGPLIEYANPACLRMLGYENCEELVGRPWEIIVSPEDLPTLRQRAEACVNAEPVAPHPGWQGVRKDGKRIWIESTISPITWHGKSAVLCFLVDVTERKQLEYQFRQAQKMDAVGRLAGGIAHDFNNLLTVINGYSEIATGILHAGDPLYEMIDQIRKAGERAASLTRQLLAFSRKQILVPTIVDLNSLLKEQGRMLGRLIGEHIDLKFRTDPDLWRIKVDPGQMEQVVLNLVVNSRDAMVDGGKLIVETKNVQLDAAVGRSHLEIGAGQYVMLAISDTGCGMDAATQALIFEPFFSTKGEKGTGLGLATVFGIVKQSGGGISVYSEVSIGTTIKIYLPRALEDAGAGNPISLSGKPQQGSETILFVEDEEGVRKLGSFVLKSLGYSVLSAGNGGEALMLGKQHEGEIHLLITDVVMPKMNGRQLAEQLLPLRPQVKVLYTSGYTDDVIAHHQIVDSGVPFLAKPFTANTLACKVREVLDGGGSR